MTWRMNKWLCKSHQHEGMKEWTIQCIWGILNKILAVVLILAIPIIVLSPMMGFQLPFQFTFPGSDWLVLILATVLFFMVDNHFKWR